jgi:hypothetical protein
MWLAKNGPKVRTILRHTYLVDCTDDSGVGTYCAKVWDSHRNRGSHALYQGPTLVGPQRVKTELGFSPWGSGDSAITVHETNDCRLAT